MSDIIIDPRSGTPYCFDCGHELDRKGICWTCYDRENQQPPEEASDHRRRFNEYAGDRWIVEDWMSDGCSEQEAIAKAKDRCYIGWLLWAGRLPEILADRYASEALRQLLISRNKGTLDNLAAWIKRVSNPTKRSKRGPRPKSYGHHVEEEILRMRIAGSSYGQIAKALGTSKSNVGAAFSNITGKIARQQRQMRDNISRQ